MERKGILTSPFHHLLQILKISLLAASLYLTIYAINHVKLTALFPIKTVKVYGLQHIDHAEIQDSLLPLVSNGFFYINVESIRERLIQIPWVADIFVRRNWPDQLEVAVIEKKAIARWDNESVLSDSGEFFVPKEIPATLPTFSGPEGTQLKLLENYREINRVFTPLHAKISHLTLTAYGTWKIALDNGVTMEIGNKDILTRLGQFVKVYPKIVGTHASDVEYVDLRYPNGMAVRWREVKTDSS